jgi:Tol biopolymer transport system component
MTSAGAAASALTLAVAVSMIGADRQPPSGLTASLAVREARIAPDGRSVAYTRGSLNANDGRRVRINLWRISFAGGDPRPLTSTDTEDSHPRWSPDGEQIAFLSRSLADRAPAHIFITPSRGGDARPLGPDAGDVTMFDWSPDGRRIGFIAAGAGGSRLRVMDVASGQAEIPSSLAGASVSGFSWAPGGSALAVATTEAGRAGTRLVIAPVAGPRTADVIASASGGSMRDVTWSPDGSTIAWLSAIGADQAPRIMAVAAAGGPVRDLSIPGAGFPMHLMWTGDGRLSVAFGKGRETWIDLIDPAADQRITVMPSFVAVLTTAPSWSSDGTRYAVVGGSEEHPPEVFAGSLPRPESGRPDTVGANPPPVRRLTFSDR